MRSDPAKHTCQITQGDVQVKEWIQRKGPGRGCLWQRTSHWNLNFKFVSDLKQTWPSAQMWVSIRIGKISWRKEWLPTPVFLPREFQWTEEPGRLQSVGSQRVQHDWVTSLSFAYSHGMYGLWSSYELPLGWSWMILLQQTGASSHHSVHVRTEDVVCP